MGDQIDLQDLLVRLGELEVTSILVEGGPTLMGSLLDAHLLHKFQVFIAPKIIGGLNAPASIAGVGAAHISDAIELKDLVLQRLGPDIWLTAYPDYE